MTTLDDFLRLFESGFGHGAFLALGVSFLAGVVTSAVCPCTLPVGLGMASAVGASEARDRGQGLGVASAFFLGIVLNLTLLGAFAGRLGALVSESFGRYWALSMAILSLLAAVVAFWELRLTPGRLQRLRRPGLAGAFGYGFVFSLGTSVAPLLLLLAVAAAHASTGNGSMMAFAFGVGRALPFLLVGVFAGAVMRIARLGSWRRTLERTSGVALLLVSLYYAQLFADLR